MIDYKHFDSFLENSIPKQVVISSGSTVLTNEDLYNQEMELEESLCSEEELRFGCCEASSLKFKISDIFSPMMGKWLSTKMIVNKDVNSPLSIGRYKVNSDKPSADRRYREIVAYDAMYDIINSSAISWYNTVLPNKDSKVTMRQFRTSFINHFGLEQEEITLANDGMIVEKTIEVGEGTEIDNETEQVSILKESSLSGKDVITAICEINGCFGHIGRDGKFHYIYLPQDTGGLYPSGNLFPDHAPEHLAQSKTGHLYPQSPNSYRIDRSKYIECDFENFFTKRITKLQIRNGENEIGKIYPGGKPSQEDNCYIIEDNFLVYGKTDVQLEEIAKNIFEKITDITYIPFNCDAIGNPCLEVGDAIRIPTEYSIVESYILNRTIKGIQSLRDVIGASGTEKYKEKVNGVQSSIIQLKGKTNTLVRNVEETRLEMADMGEGLSNAITITAKDIRGELQDTANGLSNTITATAGEVRAELQDTKDGLESQITLSAGELREELKDTKEGLETTISKTASGINETIKDTKEGLETKISKTVKGIEMSVSNDKTGKTAEVKLLITDEGGTEYEVTADKIDFTGLVSFSNLESPGQTIINGGNIQTESIDSSKINVKTLYVEDELRIRHTNPDGTSTMRTALLMEDVDGQTFPNLIVGSNRYYANIVMKNDLRCEGVNGITCSSLDVNGQSRFNKMITMSGSDIYLDKNGVTRGLKTYDKNGVYNSIIALDDDDLTTLVGCRANNDKATKTTLRGNSVVLGSSGAAVTSDERLKNSFKPLDEFDNVYMDIEPCAFKYNNGTSGRYHFGAKAQGVKLAFESHGYTTQDFGGFVQMQDNPESEDYCGVNDPMGLIYTEFTMWNMHMVQKLYKKIEEQKKEIDLLKERVSFLLEK